MIVPSPSKGGMFEEDVRRRAISCACSRVQQLLVHAGGAAHDEVAARRDVVAHEQLEDALGGVDLAGVDAPQRRVAGCMVVSASWSGSISPRPLYRWICPFTVAPRAAILRSSACICCSL
jgi:hypothetical protein